MMADLFEDYARKQAEGDMANSERAVRFLYSQLVNAVPRRIEVD